MPVIRMIAVLVFDDDKFSVRAFYSCEDYCAGCTSPHLRARFRCKVKPAVKSGAPRKRINAGTKAARHLRVQQRR